MKKLKKNNVHILTMAIGIITAMTIVFSQLFFFPVNSYAKKEVKTDQGQKQNDSNDHDNAGITLPSISQQQSSTDVEVNQKSFCLFEILFEESKEENGSTEAPILFGKFFQMLFKVIISPNAP